MFLYRNYIFHFGTTFQATPVKTFGSRTTNEKEKRKRRSTWELASFLKERDARIESTSQVSYDKLQSCPCLQLLMLVLWFLDLFGLRLRWLEYMCVCVCVCSRLVILWLLSVVILILFLFFVLFHDSLGLLIMRVVRSMYKESCEICRNVGIAGLMMVCFKCRDTREHT